MARVLYKEWRDENERRPYPFEDGATMTSDTGQVIPKAVFVDARLYPAGGAQEQYLSKIVIRGRTVTLTISGTTGALCYGSFQSDSLPDVIDLEDVYSRPAGVLVCSVTSLSVLAGWGDGTYTFQRRATRFCASTVVPMPEAGVTGFLLPDGTLFSGGPWIVAGPGVVWTMVDGIPRLDVAGDPYYKRRACQEQGIEYEEPACLMTVNQMFPSERGNISMIPGVAQLDNVVRIEVSDGEVYIYLAGGKNG